MPVVMERARSPYGHQVREAFPVTAYDAATRDPSDPSDQTEIDDFDSTPLDPEHLGTIKRLPRGYLMILVRAVFY